MGFLHFLCLFVLVKTYNYILVDPSIENAMTYKPRIDAINRLVQSAFIFDYTKLVQLVSPLEAHIIFFYIENNPEKYEFYFEEIQKLKLNFPKILAVIISDTLDFSPFAVQLNIWEYLLTDFAIDEVKRCVDRIAPKRRIRNGESKILNSPNPDLLICIRTYGEYKYIRSRDVLYIKADNNAVDFHLISGEIIPVFKSLKSIERALPYPLVRIHNSYIVNAYYIKRIMLGRNEIYIKDFSTKLPFSKTYRENVEHIFNRLAETNYYIEI